MVMEAQDYRSNGFFEDGFLRSMGVSILAHAGVFLLALGASWLIPPRKPDIPLCTVDLLTIQDMGGGGENEEGAMSKGSGEPGSAEARESAPRSPEPEAPPEPAPEETRALRMTEAVEKETVPILPAPQKIEKPVKKPRPKPEAKTKPPQKQQTIARAESPPPTAPKSESEGTGISGSTLPGQGEGLGRPDGEGAGKGHSGEGAEAGRGQGPLNAAFGSGGGPQFATKVMPRYPFRARELGKEGTVLLQITIDELGRLVDVEVLKQAGSGFDEAALQAVRSSTFKPARRNGRPVLCKARLPIVFQLKE